MTRPNTSALSSPLVTLGASNDPPGAPPRRRWWRWVAAALVTAGVAWLALMAFFRVMNSHMAGVKASECRTNLRALCTLERAYFAEHERFSERVHDLDRSLERPNRYAYYLSRRGPTETRASKGSQGVPDATSIGVDEWEYRSDERVGSRPITLADVPDRVQGDLVPGVSGECPRACVLVAVCLGNPDFDDDLDVWSVSTEPRQDPDGATIGACVPFNDHDDRSFWRYTDWR